MTTRIAALLLALSWVSSTLLLALSWVSATLLLSLSWVSAANLLFQPISTRKSALAGRGTGRRRIAEHVSTWAATKRYSRLTLQEVHTYVVVS